MNSDLEDLLFRLPPPIRRVRIGPHSLVEPRGTPGNLKPIPIEGLKVPSRLRARIRKKRHLDTPFSIDYERKLAVCIGHRDRQEQLDALVPRLQSVLSDQSIDYRIVLVEQEAGLPYNVGKMKNIGPQLASDWADYFCIHDVDQVPQSASYGCPSQPFRPIGNWSSTWRGQDGSADRPGGLSPVVTIRRDQFEMVNGFDNHYLRIGWGYDDIDFLLRCLLAGLVPYFDDEGVFRDSPNPPREDAWRAKRKQRRAKKRFHWLMLLDRIGDSGLSDLQFEVLESKQHDRVFSYLVRI